jgi:hypothetical protein
LANKQTNKQTKKVKKAKGNPKQAHTQPLPRLENAEQEKKERKKNALYCPLRLASCPRERKEK